MAKIARCVQIVFTPIIEEKADSKKKSCEFVCRQDKQTMYVLNVKERDFTASDFMANERSQSLPLQIGWLGHGFQGPKVVTFINHQKPHVFFKR